MKYEYSHLALGGTFDFLHGGHEAFLDFAFEKARFVSIGITTAAYVEKSGKTDVRPLETRLAELADYLKQKNYDKRSTIVFLDDMYGSTISDKTMDSILVTELTIKGAEAINKKRRDSGLAPLAVLLFPLIKSADGKVVSSGKIRSGEMDRNGNIYFNRISSRNYSLPDDLRSDLSTPYGEVFKSVGEFLSKNQVKADNVISVGDQTTVNLLKKRLIPKLSIIDLRIGRKQVFAKVSDLGFAIGKKFESVSNPPSSIKGDLIRLIHKCLAEEKDQNMIIKISGEEDLAVLPVVLLAPLGTIVAYGQPNEGMVAVKVTEKIKRDFLALLKKFTVDNS